MAKLRPCLAEAIGTFALIFVGVGAIKAAGSDLLAVAFAHGLTIAVMVSATMAVSGGHLNPAVTFGLLLGGKIKPGDALLYWISQPPRWRRMPVAGCWAGTRSRRELRSSARESPWARASRRKRS